MNKLIAIVGLSVASLLTVVRADEAIDYRRVSSAVVKMDLDTSGATDSAQLSIEPYRVRLIVKLNQKSLPTIDIPIDGSQQFGICPGSSPKISVVPQSEAPLNALGETPQGYEICPTCVEIVVDGGECDSLHFYWNSVTKKLSWWRA